MKSMKLRMLVAGTLTLLLYGAEAFAKAVTPTSASIPAVSVQIDK